VTSNQMTKAAVSPFAQLLGTQIRRLPKAVEPVVRISGMVITDARQINSIGLDPVEAARLKKELAKAKARAKYQRQRQDPEAMAKRKAWYEKNKEKVKAYKKAYDKKHRKAINANKLAYAKRAYQADPEAAREKACAYRAANRTAILARAKAKRERLKAEKLAAAAKEGGKHA